MFNQDLVDNFYVLENAVFPKYTRALMELSRASNTYADLDIPRCNQKTLRWVQRQDLTRGRRVTLFLLNLLNLKVKCSK